MATGRASAGVYPRRSPDHPRRAHRAEHDLFYRIRTLYKGRTVLVISYWYNTVRGADHIYGLDHGRIIEHGSHDQLITAAGVYAELFTLQAAAYTDQP